MDGRVQVPAGSQRGEIEKLDPLRLRLLALRVADDKRQSLRDVDFGLGGRLVSLGLFRWLLVGFLGRRGFDRRKGNLLGLAEFGQLDGRFSQQASRTLQHLARLAAIHVAVPEPIRQRVDPHQQLLAQAGTIDQLESVRGRPVRERFEALRRQPVKLQRQFLFRPAVGRAVELSHQAVDLERHGVGLRQGETHLALLDFSPQRTLISSVVSLARLHLGTGLDRRTACGLRGDRRATAPRTRSAVRHRACQDEIAGRGIRR